MWQRVQNLYLAISTILIGLMLFMAKSVIYGGDGAVVQSFMFTSYTPFTILIVIILIFNIIALFSYKFLVFQLRTTTISALVTLALQIWLVVNFIQYHNQEAFRAASLFPIAAFILDILAYRGTLADQLLVESSSSLRKSRRERRANR